MKLKLFLASLALLLLSGCSNSSEPITLDNLSVSCISGVQYYHYAENKGAGYKGYGYMAPAYNQDGSLKLC